MIPFTCSQCGTTYDVDEELAGKTIRCRQCREYGKVPRPITAPNLSEPDEHLEAALQQILARLNDHDEYLKKAEDLNKRVRVYQGNAASMAIKIGSDLLTFKDRLDKIGREPGKQVLQMLAEVQERYEKVRAHLSAE